MIPDKPDRPIVDTEVESRQNGKFIPAAFHRLALPIWAFAGGGSEGCRIRSGVQCFGLDLMSMHISVVAIEGDHLNEVADILRKCEYVIEETFTVQGGDNASRELDWNPDRNRVAKVAYVSDGWTFIVDPELVLMSDNVWMEYSQRWGNRVIGWVCEGASGSYGLTVFQSGAKRREVFVGGGEVAVDDGQPLPEESNMNWHEAWEDDVLEIAARIGAGYDHLADREYTIFRLDESQMSIPGSPAE